MRVRVKLFGTLRQTLPADQQEAGTELEMLDGATAGDLVAMLGLAESRSAVVVIGGKVLTPEERIPAGASASVFQTISGG